jgi:hypothetical protein
VIVGQLAVVVVREDDLARRNALSNRHSWNLFTTSHYVRCSNRVLLSSRIEAT